MIVLPVPTRRFVLILLFPLFFLVIGFFNTFFLVTGMFFDLFLLLIGVLDIIRLYKGKDFDISAWKNSGFSIGREDDLFISINNKSNMTYSAELMLDLPRFWSQTGGIINTVLAKNSSIDIACRLFPLRRGRYIIEKLHLRLKSSLGFFYLYKMEILNYKASVSPDFKELKEYFMMSRNNRLIELGIHKNRYKGRGTELESLRDYTKDDDARFIDWKVSARLNRPVTKIFQMETMNDIIFVLDCGRLMTSEEDHLSSLDLAINALLVLSHVAVSMGDRIRIITFSNKIKGDFTSSRGGNPMKNIINFITPVQPEFVESNYSLIFSHLLATVRKRSLIIFVSQIIDDINYSLFKSGFSMLSRRNAVLFMLLKDELLQREAERAADSTTDMFSITAARSMQLKRSRTLIKLKQSGINILDVLPGQVTARLVDKYMQMKSANSI